MRFFKEQVKFLGYVIGTTGISIDNERLKEIKNSRRPHNLKTLRGFLGVLNYYKRFIPDLSKKAQSLYGLLKKGVRWRWTEEHESAFNDLRNSFQESLMLNYLLFLERTPQTQQYQRN